VNSLLQAQNQSSPGKQSLPSTPKAEASTSTGESLYWAQSEDQETPLADTSVCSSMLSVQTATSVVSHAVSDMHLDLHSYGGLFCMAVVVNVCPMYSSIPYSTWITKLWRQCQCGGCHRYRSKTLL